MVNKLITKIIRRKGFAQCATDLEVSGIVRVGIESSSGEHGGRLTSTFGAAREDPEGRGMTNFASR